MTLSLSIILVILGIGFSVLFLFFKFKNRKVSKYGEKAQSIELALGQTKSSWVKARDFFKTLKISDSDRQKFEEILITSDVSIKTAQNIMSKLQSEKQKEEGFVLLRKILLEILNQTNHTIPQFQQPTVILTVGVNGVGKTTTLAKLAYFFKNQEKKVLLVAGDTFRAAAVEQLEVWSQRLEIPFFKKENVQSGAVIYEAIQYGLKNSFDIILCDTAGRLYSQKGPFKKHYKIFFLTTKKTFH